MSHGRMEDVIIWFAKTKIVKLISVGCALGPGSLMDHLGIIDNNDD